MSSRKIGLITGAGGLLGIEHASALCELGYKVVLSDIDLKSLEPVYMKLIKKHDDKQLSVLKLDVCCEQSISDASRKLIKNIGHVDVLINNAACNPVPPSSTKDNSWTHIAEFPLTEWKKHLDVGLTGAFLCSKVFGTQMASNQGGVIVNIASDLSVIAPDQRIYERPGLAEHEQYVKPVTYSVVKTGLIGLTRYLAAYWAKKNVRVNALSPGGVYNQQPDEFVKKIEQLIPLGRMASHDEYHAAIQFLCSDASKYMTGQNIVIDGGRSIL